MNKQRLTDLLEAWHGNDLTRDEKLELNSFLSDQENHKLFEEVVMQMMPTIHTGLLDDSLLPMLDSILEEVNINEQSKRKPHAILMRLYPWMKYAAILLLVIGVVYYFRPPNRINSLSPKASMADVSDIRPGKDMAVITLSDGRQIAITDSTSSINDARLIIENKNGTLIYPKHGVPAVNKMATPNGGQYKIRLADGTDVWLNAASSITYPTAFTGTQRTVSITGEVFFQVAANKSKPFVVETVKDTITVLGTAFNVRTYPEDGLIKTSLMEGAVKVNGRIIKPGQAFMGEKIFNTDLEQDIAWKNGIFDFNNADLTLVMKQLSRWYDVKIVYPEGVPNMTFGGKIGRNLTLRQVLKILDKSEVKFEVDEKNKIITVHSLL